MTMSFSAENLKQYSPYIIIGVVAGLFALATKSKTQTAVTDTGTSDQNATALVNQLATNVNNSNQQMTDYYNGVISSMNSQLQQDESSIAALTTHDTQNQQTITDLRSQLTQNNSTLNSLGNVINNVQNTDATMLSTVSGMIDSQNKSIDTKVNQATDKISLSVPLTGTGWVKTSDGNWYYGDQNKMKVANTWKQDSVGKWYYLGSDGAMTVNSNTPDGYHVNADGSWDGKPKQVN